MQITVEGQEQKGKTKRATRRHALQLPRHFCVLPSYTYMHTYTHTPTHLPAKDRKARRCFPLRLETNASAVASPSSVAPSSPPSLPSSAAAKRGDNGWPCLLLTARQVVSVNMYRLCVCGCMGKKKDIQPQKVLFFFLQGDE